MVRVYTWENSATADKDCEHNDDDDDDGDGIDCKDNDDDVKNTKKRTNIRQRLQR